MALVLENRRKARLRLLRKTALTIGALVLCLMLTYSAFRRWTLMVPPQDEGPALPQTPKVQLVDGGAVRQEVGRSSMERRDGIWRIELAGGPREMGHAHGLLVRRLSDRFERHMQGLLHRYVPAASSRWLMDNAIRWRYRHLVDWIPPRRLVELAALSRTVADTRDYAEQPFQRLVYYHAMYDMTQRLERSPLLGCTAFAVGAPHTASKHLIVGRNFDFDAGDIFDREKALIVFRGPKPRIPLVSLGWPGLIGVVSGVNARRLFVSLNAARTDDALRDGVPAVFIVRELLENADSIDAALALLKKYQPMAAQVLLIASGDEPGQAVVVELSPKRMAVRRMEDRLVGATNHFVHRTFKGDANNDRLRRYTTSDARYQRLLQLLKRFRGRIDAPTAALILRNRTDFNDEPLALGHRRAIDALIATHSVVVDLTDLVLWVSRGPHLLGGYLAVDLKPLLGVAGSSATPPEPIGADPLVDSPALARYRLVREQLAQAERLRRARSFEAAADLARRAVAAAPELPEAHKLLGDVLWLGGARQQARECYRRFVKLKPPYRAELEQVKTRLGDD